MMTSQKISLTGLGLVRFGFVHVTGLTYKQIFGLVKVRASGTSVGTGRESGWYQCDDANIVVTLDQEVWVRSLNHSFIEGLWEILKSLGLNQMATPLPKVKIMHRFRAQEIFERMADPYWIGQNERCKIPTYMETTRAGMHA